MKLELANYLDEVGATVAEVERILDLHEYPDDPRTVLVRGLLVTIDQHHRSVLLLIKSGVVGSAYALARVIIRSTRYGLWINSCATSDQILAIPQEDDLMLSIPEMNKEIEVAYQGDPFFVELRDRWAAKLHRYSSGSLVRFGQFSIDPKSGLEHHDEDVRDVVTIMTLCIVLLASKFLATQKRTVESKQVEALATAYAKES
ncbi:MAG TPA: hypothetical protein VGF61_13080 [Candidatus Acidoferrum sp.]|jgi:hypothetical protein